VLAIERNRELRPFGRRVMTGTVGEHITAPPTVLAGDVANSSLKPNSLLAGKIQGILFVWASECGY